MLDARLYDARRDLDEQRYSGSRDTAGFNLHGHVFALRFRGARSEPGRGFGNLRSHCIL